MEEREATLDDLYLAWLYQHYADVNHRNPARSFWKLTKQLHAMPFVWTVANDDNRAVDGVELRDEFIEECGVEDIEIGWLQRPCSFLEMLVALARRVSYNSLGTPADWFGKFIQNLELNFSDKHYDARAEQLVKQAVVRINHRHYAWNGEGGLFPLERAQRDQREVELWYQASAYLLEGGYIDHAP